MVAIRDAEEVSAYGIRMRYDGSVMEYVDAEGLAASRFGECECVPLVASAGPEQVIVVDVLRPEDAVTGSGDLVRVRFRVLDETVTSHIELVEVQVSDGLGQVNHLTGMHATASCDRRTTGTQI